MEKELSAIQKAHDLAIAYLVRDTKKEINMEAFYYKYESIYEQFMILLCNKH